MLRSHASLVAGGRSGGRLGRGGGGARGGGGGGWGKVRSKVELMTMDNGID